MLNLADALPDAERDRALVARANSRLQASFAHLFDVAGSRGWDLRHLRAAVDGFDFREKLSGMAHVAHNRLLAAVRANNRAEAERLSQAFAAFTYAPNAVRILALYEDGYDVLVYQDYYDACDESFRKTYGKHLDIAAINPAEKAGSVMAMQHALSRLNAIAPDLHEELDVLLSDVVLVSSPTMNAATSLCALGIVRVSALRPGQTWTRYLENMAHEAAHHHLNYVWLTEPIIENEGAETFTSPLRSEPRPLSGIYHAMFVLARTMYMIRKLERAADFKPEERISSAYNNAKNAASFEEKFEDCCATLREHARLTTLGRDLMESARDMAFAA